MTQSERSHKSYIEWLREHDPRAARWLGRLHTIDAEVSVLTEDALQARYSIMVSELQQQGKIILEAGRDWELIYELNKQSHSMQAPFCDTSGYAMNMPQQYVVLNNADLAGRVKELIITIEYPQYHTD